MFKVLVKRGKVLLIQTYSIKHRHLETLFHLSIKFLHFRIVINEIYFISKSSNRFKNTPILNSQCSVMPLHVQLLMKEFSIVSLRNKINIIVISILLITILIYVIMSRWCQFSKYTSSYFNHIVETIKIRKNRSMLSSKR